MISRRKICINSFLWNFLKFKKELTVNKFLLQQLTLKIQKKKSSSNFCNILFKSNETNLSILIQSRIPKFLLTRMKAAALVVKLFPNGVGGQPLSLNQTGPCLLCHPAILSLPTLAGVLFYLLSFLMRRTNPCWSWWMWLKCCD